MNKHQVFGASTTLALKIRNTYNRFSVDTINLALNELLFRVNATLTQSSK